MREGRSQLDSSSNHHDRSNTARTAAAGLHCVEKLRSPVAQAARKATRKDASAAAGIHNVHKLRKAVAEARDKAARARSLADGSSKGQPRSSAANPVPMASR